MGEVVDVQPYRKWQTSTPPRPRRKLTPVWKPGAEPTFTAPLRDPGGSRRMEKWDVYSRDGLWHYQRQDGVARARWVAVFRPTGQRRENFPTVEDAREATAGGLVNEMRTEAFTLALRTRLDNPKRAVGHRWLAIHMRVAGLCQGEEAGHRCVCGGFIASATLDADVVHLDACDVCYSYGAGLPAGQCEHAERHRFCGDPLAVAWAYEDLS